MRLLCLDAFQETSTQRDGVSLAGGVGNVCLYLGEDEKQTGVLPRWEKIFLSTQVLRLTLKKVLLSTLDSLK